MTDSDEALVLASQRNDRLAFETLVRRTGRLVYCRLLLDCGDRHLADDLSQETFLVAWRSIRQVAEPSGFRRWLLSVARSVLLDARRHGARRKRSASRSGPLDRQADDLADPQADPSAAAERDEARQRVLAVLRALPAEYRDPLALRYLAGADYQTIGRQLGLSNGALRGLLARGMARLRAAMQESEV